MVSPMRGLPIEMKFSFYVSGDVNVYMTGDCFDEIRNKKWIIWRNELRPMPPGDPPLSYRRSQDHSYCAWSQIYRIFSNNIDTHVKFHVTFPRRKMSGLTIVHSLLNEMDLDIVRVAIYNNAYHTGYFFYFVLFIINNLYRCGGIDLFEAYYDPRGAQAKQTPNLTPEELDEKTEELELRCTKYISRLDYEHFCQFTTPLDQMNYAGFSSVKSKFNLQCD